MIFNPTKISPRNVVRSVTLIGMGLLLGHLTSIGQANRAAPTEHSGVSVESLGVVSESSLKGQIDLGGHVMQLREITLMPGGTIKKHSHANRPGLVLTVSGSWVEGRSDGEKTYSAGEMNAIVEDSETEHWFFNDGDKPAKVVVCDIVPAS